MGGSISGISSGMDTESIINGLMSIKRQRIDNLTVKSEGEQAKKDVWTSISSRLITLQLSSYTMSRTATFDSKSANVSDADVLSVGSSVSSAVGSYSFYVQQLATNHQLSTNGFNDFDDTAVGAGSISIELGDGDVDKKTELNNLNDGDGISRGYIKITDKDGSFASIDLSDSMYLEDVLNSINSNSTIDVTASINTAGDGINITDNTGGAGTLVLEEVNNGTTLTDLGLNKVAVANTVSGNSIQYLTTDSFLNGLNDNLGIEKQSIVISGTGSSTIDLTSANTMNDVLSAINAETATTNVQASLAADGKGFRLEELGAGTFTVTENGYNTANDLGILATVATSDFDGSDLISGMDSILLKNLSGAQAGKTGISGTDFTIGSTDIDISTAVSLRDVINLINTQAAGENVAARVNSTGNGIELYSTDSSNFTVVEKSGSTAESLGIFGTSASGVLKGGDLDFKYIGENTLLSSLNQGEGVRRGKIEITNNAGVSFEVDLSSSTSIKTMGDVIDKINTEGASSNITAEINSTGDGILIKDTVGGASNLNIAEVGTSHMAKDLGILGSATGSEYDGSFEKTITVSATSTLADVQDAINDLGLNIKASIINDGTTNPYRLVLSADSSGQAGRMIFDTDISILEANTATDAKDALLIMGEPTSENAVFVHSSKNQVSNFISGMTIDLKKTSSSPVSINVTTNTDSIIESATDFIEKYNSSMAIIAEQLEYDSDTGESGELFGDSTLMMIQQDIFSTINKEAEGLTGAITNMVQVGFSMGLGGQLTLNESTLRTVLETDFEDVKDFFTYRSNIAISSTASAGSVTGGSVDAASDGNSSLSDFESGATGWQGANGTNVTLDFGETKELTSLKLFGVDTSSDDILKSFTLQYFSAGEWKDYRTITGNTSADINMNFFDGLVTNKIRLNNLQSTGGGDAKIIDLQVYQPTGLGAALEHGVSKITDATTGAIDSALDGIEDNIDVLADQIESMEERMVIEEERLRKQWVALESMMSELSGVSSYLEQQSASLNSNWNYK